MGSIIEFPTFYDHMPGRENLRLHCEYMGFYQDGSIDSALEMLDLTEAAGRQVKSYSMGMRPRLGIARAVLTRPELLILDEPTNGLDPAGMKQIRDLLKTLCSEYGITVMVSTHILSEIESIADTIGVIHRGCLKKEVSMKEIEEMSLEYIELKTQDTKRAAFVLSNELNLDRFKIMDGGRIRIYEESVPIQTLSKTLSENEVGIEAIGRKAGTLEDYFLKITGEVD